MALKKKKSGEKAEAAKTEEVQVEAPSSEPTKEQIAADKAIIKEAEALKKEEEKASKSQEKHRKSDKVKKGAILVNTGKYQLYCQESDVRFPPGQPVILEEVTKYIQNNFDAGYLEYR